MRILISGASGLVGTALRRSLTAEGHEVIPLTRKPSAPTDVAWDVEKGVIEEDRLSGFDAVVHLAGESIVGRWTEEKKQRIRDSRVKGTRLLCEALVRQPQPPPVLVSASAIGYYGDRGDEVLTEESPPGTSFLADVCTAWEEATAAAQEKGIRVVRLRIGLVLSTQGGSLKKMLLPFRLGMGGVIGSGKQWLSWIAIDDLVAAIRHCLNTEAARGPVNAVSPNPVTNREFTKTLGRVLKRPTVLPMPAFAARAVFGEMADELLLASARVVPVRLQQTGFAFAHPHLEEALRQLLEKSL